MITNVHDDPDVEVSVIMPAFNAAPHVAEQLRALAGQDTALRWELIVSDNGSTDGTLGVVMGHLGQVPRLRIVDSSDVQGAAHARNFGAAVARAPLLLFCDADDVVDALWVESMARGLRESPLVGGSLEPYQLNRRAAASWRGSMQEQHLSDIRGRPYVVSANLGCTRRLFDSLNRFDESFVGAAGEDVDFSLRAARHAVTPRFVPDAVIHYRYRADLLGATRQAWRYGATHAVLLERHELGLPTVVDDSRIFYRLAKQAARETIQKQFPGGPVVQAAFFAGEAGGLWRERAFWRPVSTYTKLSDHWLVHLRRLQRLWLIMVRRR